MIANVRQAAIQALGDRAQVSDLLPLLQDSNSDVRQAAIQALGDRAQVSDLLPLLQDSDSNVRLPLCRRSVIVRRRVRLSSLSCRIALVMFAAAIQTLGDRAQASDLLPLLQDNQWNVR